VVGWESKVVFWVVVCLLNMFQVTFVIICIIHHWDCLFEEIGDLVIELLNSALEHKMIWDGMDSTILNVVRG